MSDLSKLNDDDLRAYYSGNMQAVSDEGLAIIYAEEQVENPNFFQRAGKVVSDTANQLMELPASSNRSLGGMADVVLSPFIAAERQIRPYAQAALGNRDFPDSPRAAFESTKPFSFREQMTEKGEFGGEGIATDILSSVGGVIPAALTMGAGSTAVLNSSTAPVRSGKFLDNLKSVGQELLRTTPKQELFYGTTAAAGGEAATQIAGDSAGLVAEFLAPIAMASGTSMVRGTANLLRDILADSSAMNQMARSLGSVQDTLAAQILADGMAREGMSVDDVIKELDKLGPDALPVDLNETFRSILRAATNANPTLRGQAKKQIYERSANQGERLRAEVNDVLDAPDVSVNQAIDDVAAIADPLIKELYKTSGEQALRISPQVKSLLEGDNSIGRAMPVIERRLSDLRAAGEEITHFDLINVAKQEIDDQIGFAIVNNKPNEARTLILLKNKLIEDADNTIPTYKKARNLFAGKIALNDAAKHGENFMKMRSREMTELVKYFTEAELKMFRVGARQAIFDAVDNTQMTADLFKKMFGRNGDVNKLRALFTDDPSFEQFYRSMRREAEFIMTRNTALGNSTTVTQSQDLSSLGKLKDTTRRVMSIFAGGTQGKVMAMTDIADGIATGAGNEEFDAALRRAGELLLTQGMPPEKIRRLLEEPQSKAFADALEIAFKFNSSPITSRLGSQAARSGTLTEITGDN